MTIVDDHGQGFVTLRARKIPAWRIRGVEWDALNDQMPVLLDNHVLVRAVAQDRALSLEADALSGAAAYDSAMFVSAISLREITVPAPKQRLALELPVQPWAAQPETTPALRIHLLAHEIARDNRLLAYGRRGHIDVRPA